MTTVHDEPSEVMRAYDRARDDMVRRDGEAMGLDGEAWLALRKRAMHEAFAQAAVGRILHEHRERVLSPSTLLRLLVRCDELRADAMKLAVEHFMSHPLPPLMIQELGGKPKP